MSDTRQSSFDVLREAQKQSIYRDGQTAKRNVFCSNRDTLNAFGFDCWNNSSNECQSLSRKATLCQPFCKPNNLHRKRFPTPL